MKDKLTVRKEMVERIEAKQDLAGVKIVEKISLGDEIILIVRFRSPANLFNLARYIFDPETKPLITKVNAKKSLKKVT